MTKLRALISFLSLALVLTGAGCITFTGFSNKQTTTGNVGFYLSRDSGETWRGISLLPTAEGVKSLAGVPVYGLVEDKNDPKAMYWLSRTRGLLYSYDEGATWNESVAPLNTGYVYGVAIHPKDNCTIFATNGRQVFKTTDCNRSWTEMYREGIPTRSIKMVAINPFPPYEVFIMSDSGVLLKSVDSGTSWSVVHQFKTSVQRLVFDYNKPGLVYVASTANGLYRSRDGGASWSNLKSEMSSYPGANQFRRLYIYPSKAEQVYWISQYGILVSKNGGEDWDPISLITPPGGTSIYSFAVNPKNEKEIYYTSTVSTRTTFYKTTDGGKSWVTRKLPTGQVPVVLRIHPDNPEWLYMGFTVLETKK